MRRAALVATPALLASCALFGGDAYEVVYAQACSEAACVEDFVFTDRAKWRMHEGAHGPALELLGKSDYRPPHRSPFRCPIDPPETNGDRSTRAPPEEGRRGPCPPQWADPTRRRRERCAEQ